MHDEHFPQDTPDQVWLRKAGEEQWVVLTKDERIRYRTLERRALMAARVRTFVLTAKGLNAQEMGSAFVLALPAMLKLLSREAGPFIAKISRSGKVSLIDI